MNKSRKQHGKLRVLALTVGVIGILAALGASSASAAMVNAKFNAATIKISGTLTVKRNGGEAKTCERPSITGTVGPNPAVLEIYTSTPQFQTNLTCTGGTTLGLPLYAAMGRYDTVSGAYSFKLYLANGGHSYMTPWGLTWIGYGQSEVNVPWTNGSGSTPSALAFNETYIGARESDFSKITVSGSLNATTSSGGLLTLSH